MDAVNFSEFRSHLKTYLDKVGEDHTPLLIMRPQGIPAVLISLDDFHGYEETAYLMSSPANAKRLAESIASTEYLDHDLIEVDDE